MILNHKFIFANFFHIQKTSTILKLSFCAKFESLPISGFTQHTKKHQEIKNILLVLNQYFYKSFTNYSFTLYIHFIEYGGSRLVVWLSVFPSVILEKFSSFNNTLHRGERKEVCVCKFRNKQSSPLTANSHHENLSYERNKT